MHKPVLRRVVVLLFACCFAFNAYAGSVQKFFQKPGDVKGDAKASLVKDGGKQNCILINKPGAGSVRAEHEKAQDITGVFKVLATLKLQGSADTVVRMFAVTTRQEYTTAPIKIPSNRMKTFIMSFDTHFGFGDAKFKLVKLGFIIEGGPARLFVKEVKVGDAGAVREGGEGKSFLVKNARKPVEKLFDIPSLKIKQDFNNEDFHKFYGKRRRTNSKIVEEPNRNRTTFCDIMTQPVSDYFSHKEELQDDTDVIVFCRNTANWHARLEGVKINKRNFQPGETAQITYYWRNVTPFVLDKNDYKTNDRNGKPGLDRVAVHFMHPSVKPHGIARGNDHWLRPSLVKWMPGELVVDGPHKVNFPKSMPKGAYKLRVSGWFMGGETVIDKFMSIGKDIDLPDNGFIVDQEPERTVAIADDFAQVCKAVEGGKGILMFGKVAGYFDELMPVTIEKDYASTEVGRENLVLEDKANLLFKNMKLTSVSLAKYLDVKCKDGAKVLARFAGGNPAIVEMQYGKGKVLYFAFGLGQDVASSEVFHDELYIRSLYYLSGNAKAIERLAPIAEYFKAKEAAEDLSGVLSVLNEKDNGRFDRELAGVASLQSRLEKARNATNSSVIVSVAKELEEIRAQVDRKAGGEYHVGASEDNFGRFGWVLKEGLMIHDLDDSLTCSTGPRENYAFGFSAKDEAFLPGIWKFSKADSTGLEKGFAKPDFDDSGWMDMKVPGMWEPVIGEYDGIGWYRTKIKIPSRWKGKKAYLRVKGIDDVDVAYLNGHKIGETTTKTPHYWQAERLYEIKPEAIVYDAENVVAIQVNDLRGGGGIAGAASILVPSKESDENTVAVTSVDWTTKQMDVVRDGKLLKVTESLMYPGTLYETAEDDIFLNTSSIVSVAVPLGGEIKVIDTSAKNDFYDRARDGGMDENWILGWKTDPEGVTPLLLIFERNPQSIFAQGAGGSVTGLALKRTGGLGKIVIAYPFGKRKVMDTDKWSVLPGGVAEKCRMLSGMAVNFPVKCDEVYFVDEKSGVVEITDRIRTLKIEDEWGTPGLDFAPLPPLVWYLHNRGNALVASVDGRAGEVGLLTKYGELAGVSGSNVVSYSLRIPEHDNRIYIGINSEKRLSELLNEHFRLGNRWSCGGGVKREAWTFKMSHPNNNFIDISGWSMGLMCALTGKEFLGADERKQLRERASYRYQKAIELYQYKSVVDCREEPFSGLRYPMTFYSFYKNDTRYEKGLGSAVIYGDQDEAALIVSSTNYLYSLQYGEWDFARANWKFVKDVMKQLFVSDCWYYMGTGCREYSASIHIDMLNCEYPGLMMHAKFARAMGDEKEARRSIYRAMRRAIPTIARFWILEYPEYRTADSSPFATGFSEEMVKPLPKVLSHHSLRGSVAIFDMSKYTYREMDSLYRAYANDRVKQYQKELFLPSVKARDVPISFAAMRNFAMFGWDTYELEKWLEDTHVRYPAWSKDWPGIMDADRIGAIIHARRPGVWLIDWIPARMVNSLYDWKAGKVSLQLENNDSRDGEWAVRLHSEKMPSSVKVNGKTVKQGEGGWTYDKENKILTIAMNEKGKVDVAVTLGK